ncbi:HEAT repeat domain-containing protein [Zunongwangia sp.]|uniref:HEAT repeat domain-containing protein n=1 Tax=Zunongwangia sp. TaxID=1965325 RepID=UPI003AA80D0A
MIIDTIKYFKPFNQLLDNLPSVMRVNIIVSIVFIVFIVIFISLIIYLRYFKNSRNNKKEKQRLLLEEFLNSYLFDEDFDAEKEILNFKKQHVISNLQKKIASREILLYNSNLKGETSEMLRNLFCKWELDEFSKNQLLSSKWYLKSRAIFSLSEMLIEVDLNLIIPLLNHPKDEVRQQAQLYFIKTAKAEPLNYLTQLKRPLTLWEEIFVEDALKNEYHGEIPDFSKWLYSNDGFTIFAIRMIARFNQYENIPKLLPLLNHASISIRCAVLNTLAKLEYFSILPIVKNMFDDSEYELKMTILEVVEHFEDTDLLHDLKTKITIEDWNLNLKFYTIAQKLLPDEKENLYLTFKKEKAVVI